MPINPEVTFYEEGKGIDIFYFSFLVILVKVKMNNTFKKILLSFAAATTLFGSIGAEAQPVYVGSLLQYQDENASGLPCWQGNPNVSPRSEAIVPCSITSPAKAPVRINTYVNTYTGEFNFTVLYPRDDNGAFPEGVSFLVSDGEEVNEPQTSGSHAIYYVDASRSTQNPTLNIFAFNSTDVDMSGPFLTSWLYGKRITDAGELVGISQADNLSDNVASNVNPLPPVFDGMLSGTWSTGSKVKRGVYVNDYTVSDGSSINGLDVREFTVNLDASKLNARNFARYPDGASWVGTSIGGGLNPSLNPDVKKIFVGLYGFNGLNTSYETNIANAGFGYLNSWLGTTFKFGIFFLHNKSITETPIDCTGTPGGTSDCSNPTPTPSPSVGINCVEKSWNNDLFALDGGAAALHELNIDSCKQLVKLWRGLVSRTDDRRVRYWGARIQQICGSVETSGLLRTSFDSFMTAWTAAWSFPSRTLDCSNGGTFDSSLCQSVSFASNKASFQSASNGVYEVTKILFRRLADVARVYRLNTTLDEKVARTAGVRAQAIYRSIRNQSAKYIEENDSLLANLPSDGAVVCD